MVKRAFKFLIPVLALCHLGAAAASAVPQAYSNSELYKFKAWREQAVRVLAARADANSLATAAALSFSGRAVPSAAAAALQLIARASELSPDSAAIDWLHLQLCAASPGCDSRDVATVLRWVDPDNGAAWLASLSTAHKDKDTIEIDRVLADMARGTRFDLYYNQLLVLMFDALSAVRRQLPSGVIASDAAKFTALAGVARAELIPPLAPLAAVCREPAVGERRENCLKLAKIMQKGDTVIVQMTGFNIEKFLLPPESREAKSAADRKRLLEWRTAAAENLDASILPWTRNTRTRSRLAEMRLRPREEDVCIALLREHKMALEPAENHR
ncbi:MAG: hypothetical protein QOK23_3492 [Gammaproteobacteria bacterium]|nr:hypothetical protein [Gammaproteobacteria bacterium]MEA3141323.1 hypothetical protein [Gammaproteobacteria bacterium]